MERLFTKCRQWFILLTIIALVVSFTGCGSAESNNSDVNNTSVSTNNTQNMEVQTDPTSTISFEEIIAVDNDCCIIKIIDFELNSFLGCKATLFLESKSTDTTYMFAVRGASVNGIDIPVAFGKEVAPGKKANAELTFPNDLPKDIDFTDIELTFYVYDNNNWMADPVAEKTVHIYPYGQENATQYIREPQESDTVLVDNEYVTAIITGYEIDDIWGYSANIYLVNKTDVEVMFAVDEVSINGFMVDPFWARSVRSGMSTFSSISWYESTLEENGIKTVENIEFVLKARNYKDLFAEDFANQIISLTP